MPRRQRHVTRFEDFEAKEVSREVGIRHNPDVFASAVRLQQVEKRTILHRYVSRTGSTGQCTQRARAAQRLLRPDARALARPQRALRRRVREGDAGPSSRSSSRTAARARRRARSSTGSRPTSSRSPRIVDTDAISKKGLIKPGWVDRLAEPLAALHFDDRVRRPQGQPQGHQGLARPGQARRRDHHAEPEDLGQRLPDASSAPGARSSCAAARATTPIEYVTAALQAGPGARLGRARRHHDLRPEEDRRRAPGLGERGAPRSARGEGRARARLPADQHPGRAARRRGRRQRRPQEDPRSRRGVPEVPRTPTRRRRSSPSTSTGRATRRS